MRRTNLHIALVAVLWIGSTVHAGVTAEFVRDKDLDPTDWQNAVGNSYIYEDFADGSYAAGISAIGGPDFSLAGGYYVDNVDGSTYTTVQFAPDVLAAWLSVDLNPLTVGTGLDVYVVFSDDATHLLPVRNNTTNGGDTVNGFVGQVGFVADMPVKEIRIFEGPQTNLGGSELYHGLDLYFSYSSGPAVLLGDANNDGVVSADDFAAVQTNFGNTGPDDGLLPGDANDDGVVSADDFAAIQTNFGAVLAAAAQNPIPEPATLGLLSAAMACVLRRR